MNSENVKNSRSPRGQYKTKYDWSEMKGQKYNRLTVLEVFYDKGNKVKCVCDCGNEVVAIASKVSKGDKKSCGCLTVDLRKTINVTHGETRGEATKLYHTWVRIKMRCYNPRNDSYPHYGGRGIKVCDRWLNSFENFKEDMGQPPTKHHSIDRIDVNGDYTPENTRWASTKEQLRNTTVNHLIEFNGKTQCISAWAEEIGITHCCLWLRLYQYGWSIEKALTTPKMKKGKTGELKIEYNGENLTLPEWAEKTGLTADAIRYRFFKAKWSAEKTLTTPSSR